MCNQDARNVRAMRRVVHRETGRRPPKRLRFSTLLALVLLCGGDPPPRRPRGGRSARENELLRRHGAAYMPAWFAAWRLAGVRGWARHVFCDLDGHGPGCRWARFLRWARP